LPEDDHRVDILAESDIFRLEARMWEKDETAVGEGA
jgi:hypothetical protein